MTSEPSRRHGHLRSGESGESGESGGAALRSSVVGRAIVIALLVIVGVITVAGLIHLWPDGAKVKAVAAQAQFAVPDATFPSGRILSIADGCADDYETSAAQPGANACETATVQILTGDRAGQTTEVELVGPEANAGLVPGDQIELLSLPPDPTVPGDQALDSFFGVLRGHSLLAILIAFVLVVLAVAWLRGLLALVALAFSAVMIVLFVLPAVLIGTPGVLVALVGSAAIMYVVVYLAHGVSIRTSTALLGTLVGIGITTAIAQWAVGGTRLSGFTDESAGTLSTLSGSLDFRGLITCGIIIAGLGVLNDVTITQASAVWELRAAGPGLSRWRIFWSAMRIGRDHIASTIYTIVFAYAGASLSVLLLLYLYERPLIEMLGFEDIATEIVRTLCSAIGLVIAVPITTAIAAVLMPGAVGESGVAEAEKSSP